jgi:hypothetical protein
VLDSLRAQQGPAAVAEMTILLHETEQYQDQLAGLQALKNQKGTIKIFPANGTTAADGHRFVRVGEVWAPDVFAFLDKYLK